jgi:hypothetical protein
LRQHQCHPGIRASRCSARTAARGLASQLKPIPSACLTPAFRPGSRPVERGKDMLARLTRKRRSTLPPGHAIKHLVVGRPAATAAP